MTSLDQFFAIVVVASVVGLLLLSLSYVDVSAITVIDNATANITTFTPASFAQANISTAKFFGTIAVILVIVLIIYSWMLSAFIKASPLSSVISIAYLIVYSIVAILMSHYMIDAAHISIFTSLGGSANLVFLFWANMPVILIFATVIDIGIAAISWRAQ